MSADSAVGHVLLTRPKPQSDRFAARLRARFPKVLVTVSPLLRIVLRPPAADVLAGAAGVIFTSENGVAGFVAGCAARHLPAWAVGPRTAAAAREAGFDTVHPASGDAQALLALLLDTRPKGALVHLRGTHVAADIAGALHQAGLKARDCVVYAQEAEDLTAEARALLSEPGAVLAPVFSPRSGRLLAAALRARPPRARVTCVAISAAAAQPMVQAGFGADLRLADAPDALAMEAALAAALDAAALGHRDGPERP